MSSDFFKVKKGLNIKPTDPSTLGELQDGDIVIDSTAGNSMKIYSTEAGGFSEVGTGSGINYIDNNSFDGGVTGWTGDTNLVISKEDVSPLRGTGSLKIAKAAANASGEQVYTDFTIDAADLAKKLTITFDIDASDANYSDDDMIVKIIKDPAGTPVTISVNGAEIKGEKYSYIGQFQTDATELDYRLVIEQVSAQTSAVNIIIDNVSVGPREVAKGTIVTDWKDDPEITKSNFTVNSETLKTRRVGGNLEIQYKADIASVSGGIGFNLGNYSVDTANAPLLSSLGVAVGVDAGTGSYTGTAYLSTSSIISITGPSNTQWAATVPFTWASGDDLSITVSVPIQGWSSNAVMSEDLGGREVYVHATPSTTQSVTSGVNTILDFGTSYEDTTASWDGSRFTAPETGKYLVSVAQRVIIATNFNGTTERLFLQVNKNGAAGSEDVYRLYNDVPPSGTTGLEIYPSGSVIVDMVKGDYIEIVTNQNSGASLIYSNGGADFSKLQISKLASPQTILETETVAARYSSNSGQSIPDSTQEVLVYEDSHGDTHNAYNTSTGEYTIPISGWYNVSAALQYDNASFNAGITHEIAIRINGSDQIKDGREVNATNTTRPSNSVSGNLLMEKGDVVTITTFQNTGSNKSVRANSSRNTFSIARIK